VREIPHQPTWVTPMVVAARTSGAGRRGGDDERPGTTT
jgi:hypothetical protein